MISVTYVEAPGKDRVQAHTQPRFLDFFVNNESGPCFVSFVLTLVSFVLRTLTSLVGRNSCQPRTKLV